MAGLLESIFGAPGSDQSQAMGLLGAMLMQGRGPEGFAAANQFMAESPKRKMQADLLALQMREAQEALNDKAGQREASAMERKRLANIEANLPSLYRQPGFSGGEAIPQQVGGIPMFSQPMTVGPMQPVAGGFDMRKALTELRMKPAEAEAYAKAFDYGRPEVARTIEGTDAQGRKIIRQFDKAGNEIGGGVEGYVQPVQVNQGNQSTFVRPAAGVSLPINMSTSERDASARGWASNRIAQERLNMEQGNLVADSGGPSQVGLVKQFGKPSAGYRWRQDGTQEAIPGGPADIKAGEVGRKAEKAQESAIVQADSVLSEIRDAKKLVGWNTTGVGGLAKVVPMTEARDLSAKLETVKANLGFDRLQQMREQSPTGGALGQVAVQELTALQSTVASLDQLQSPQQIGRALDKIERHYTNWRNTIDQARNGSGGATGGWDIREKK